MLYNDITLIFKFLGSHFGILFPVSPYFPQFFAIFSSESSSSLYHSKRSMSSALLYLLSVLVSSCQEFISTQLNIPFQNLSSPFSSETFVVDFSIGHKLPIFWNLLRECVCVCVWERRVAGGERERETERERERGRDILYHFQIYLPAF